MASSLTNFHGLFIADCTGDLERPTCLIRHSDPCLMARSVCYPPHFPGYAMSFERFLCPHYKISKCILLEIFIDCFDGSENSRGKWRKELKYIGIVKSLYSKQFCFFI